MASKRRNMFHKNKTQETTEEGYMLLVLWTACGLFLGSDSSYCCPGSPNHILKSKTCPDNTNITLDCNGQSMYILDPDRDYFRIENGHLLLPGKDDEQPKKVPSIEFCLAARGINGTTKTVALLCFMPMEEGTSKDMMVIYSYCLLVSVVFLIITFITYCMLPSLRDLQGRCVMCFVASLIISYTSLSITQLEFLGYEVPANTCVFAGFNTYFWFLCVFFWLCIISFNIWRTARSMTKWDESTLWVRFLILGFGGPFLLLCIAMITHHVPGDHIKPNFNEYICWFPGHVETWVFFYGPMTILLLCNITFFFMTTIRLWQDYRNTTPQPRIRVLRFKCILYLKLFLTMGISWIFEIISFLVESNWYITDILNTLQGVIIFLIMVATRKRVLRALAKNKMCGTYFNENWQTMPDEESEVTTQREQIQLS